MKVVILHPPLYPVNHTFFNLLGKHVELTVYNFGEYPRLHKHWSIHEIKKEATNYKIKVFGKGPISFKTQVNPSFIKDLILDKPDFVISVAFWIPSLYASLLKRLFGYKFLISTDAIEATEVNISGNKKRLREFISQNVDTFISASALTSRYLHSLSPQTKIKESLQTIDTTSWNLDFEKLATKEKLREELNLPLDKTILFGLGSFTQKKNWTSIFSQMSLLDNCIFVLIGFGELEDSYNEYIQNSNLEDRIYILSRKEGQELKKYFKLSDIFIFPSLYDQFGYVVLEALASGLPVICSENSGASSLIKNHHNGFVINPNNDYVEEIEIIISDLEKFQLNAFETMKKYTLENKIYELLNTFKELENE
jgi:glycosyltransferase involved in cell wall biosynthesis